MKKLAISIATTVVAVPCMATEGGGSIYSPGTENFMCCAVPPPGLYGLVYAQHYSADRAVGNDGQTTTPSTFKVKADAIVGRLSWVTPFSLAGGSLALHAIVPMVSLSVDVAPGLSQSKKGQGDVVFGPAIGWHHSPALHSVVGLDIIAPTGQYKKGDLANIGRNYLSAQAVYGVSLIDPSGLNADAKLMYTVNKKNSDTDYKSGEEFIADLDAGWGLGNGWTLGLGGYVYQQLSNDEQGGATVSGTKGRALAIGPSVKYDSGKGWFVTLKYQKESSVRNRAVGEGLLLKAAFPF